MYVFVHKYYVCISAPRDGDCLTLRYDAACFICLRTPQLVLALACAKAVLLHTALHLTWVARRLYRSCQSITTRRRHPAQLENCSCRAFAKAVHRVSKVIRIRRFHLLTVEKTLYSTVWPAAVPRAEMASGSLPFLNYDLTQFYRYALLRAVSETYRYICIERS